MSVDVPTLIRNVEKLFYSLYDEYAKFYGPSLDINFEQNDAPSIQALTNRIDNSYQLLFQKTINHQVPPPHHQHKARHLSFKLIYPFLLISYNGERSIKDIF